MPVLVMRDTIERPKGMEAGTLRLVKTEQETLYNIFTELLENEELYKKIMHIVCARAYYLTVNCAILDLQEIVRTC